jgi:hypothetical protein
MTHHTEKHPNEILGLDVDATRPSLSAQNAPRANANYRRMKCFDRMTKEFQGWLGSYGNNLDLVHSTDDAAYVAWSDQGSDKFLRKDAVPGDRYLGLGWNSYACWGLTGGWNDAVIYNDDKSVSLKIDPKRKLCKYGNDWIRWSEDNNNANILTLELE